MAEYKIIKKDGTLEDFSDEKILIACGKSAARALTKLTKAEEKVLLDEIRKRIEMKGLTEIPVSQMHLFVENSLRYVNPAVAEEYCRYRDHKKEFAELLDGCFRKANEIQFGATETEEKNENANSNDTLVSTKRCLIFNEFNKVLYQNFFLTKEELEATKDGYIYIHDMSARRDTMN